MSDDTLATALDLLEMEAEADRWAQDTFTVDMGYDKDGLATVHVRHNS